MVSQYKGGLVFGRDLTPLPTPLHTAVADSPHILIVGGGVIGLVNAWTLLDHGYRVTILAKEWASYGKTQRLTSQIAGALWEFPPAVCGQHTDAISLQHSKRWCMVAYHIWDAMAASESLAKLSGVQMKAADVFLPVPIEEDPAQMSKMLDIMSNGVRGFRRDPAIIKERRVNPTYGAVDAYEHLAPIIDTDVCMAFLKELVAAKGARLVTRAIAGDLFDQEASLRTEFSADVLVNSTGLAGTELAGDASCYPIRGGLIRVINDGSDFPKLDHALTIPANTTHVLSEIVFLVPRSDNILLIGGIAESHENTLDLTLESPVIKRMRARCEAFFPDLVKARLDSEYPFAQGLRPFRQRNVRVERELRIHSKGVDTATPVSRIVHSYGQGGAGWSLSFGCAGDVLALVEEALLDIPARPMMLEIVAPSLYSLIYYNFTLVVR
ncbi:nucleotide-binding domain-containing protein [Dothidotthia symphoricarpi CBS 119687]|uniref:Nucleotide-binding domain-containing protein n=1 Tax=Dothidotthia symphoricarpi CBS 119687 TaxID=1392245 RepID=A0A6A6APG5_9PLEO|nr:nucleotide-binding domain-containing protein [Dothidotthia symphoricarpi CBS 119687]KAF2133083.1 nucleotide-binding domain-containing protein [Dothidotthia symphoricarpi CBS 119687]